MKVNWFLESDLFENLDRLIAEIKAQGHNLTILSNKSHWDTKLCDLFDDKDCVIFYGSIQMGATVNRETPWLPGLYCTTPNYDCTKYYPLFGEYLLNSNYAMVPYGDLIRRKDWLYEHLGIDDTIFIRPNKGNKIFTGKSIYKDYFEKDYELLGFYDVDPHELCVVAEPRNVEKEWRFLIVDGAIVAGSEYTPDTRDIFPADSNEDDNCAIGTAVAALSSNSYSPDRAWTLDVCKTSAGNFYVLEVGCFSCAGLYGMNMEKVVRKISELAVEDWKEVYEK